MEYRRCNCLTHLRDCALQSPIVRERARAEHIEQNLIPRRVPRAPRDTHDGRPALVHEANHGSAQYGTLADWTFPLPGEDGSGVSLPYTVPSTHASTSTILHVPDYQLPAARSTYDYLTYYRSSPPSADGRWSSGAMRTSEELPLFYATADVSPMLEQAPREPQFETEWSTLGLGLGTEPSPPSLDVEAVFRDVSQGTLAIGGPIEALPASTTTNDDLDGWIRDSLDPAFDISAWLESASGSGFGPGSLQVSIRQRV
ncbi:hypothetical protein PsYK624_148220 [Phanerochaete sordida]|uniref:Uncharacterized protein n=1 Tax=Phanerochaete sordida TaxID=48140 RepID=A0A9P3LLD8_9APHY|nr:hypothetical protein PsYK624_148220 [Phanerochaete sordida]